MKRLTLLVGLLATACAMPEEKKDCAKEGQCDELKAEETQPDFFNLKGSVVGSFDIEVNGKGYADIEDFYSQEIANLPEQIEAVGLEGYSMRLEGQLGLHDLTNNMDVFVAPLTNRGYSSQTKVVSDGTFMIRFPIAAADDVYQVRATKRIKLVLTKYHEDYTEVKNICYNFSALESKVDYEELDLPVILSEFTTKVTKYECETEVKSVLQLPN